MTAKRPGEWLERYKTGEREAVWDEMRALGTEVRAAPHLEPAWQVARETMKRARRNVELIIQRLDALGYQFWNGERTTPGSQAVIASVGGRIVMRDSPMEQMRSALAMDVSHIPGGAGLKQMLAGLMGPYQAAQERAERERRARMAEKAAISDHLKDPGVFGPPTADEISFIRGLEAKGMVLPLAWRAWIEDVGDVNLAGAHPTLSFWEGPDFPGVYADPLMVTLDHFSFEVEGWERDLEDGEAPGPFAAVFGVDPRMKARLAVAWDQLDEGYAIEVPDEAADALVRLGGREVWFVDYLREAFRWGGFRGWAGRADAPHAELAQLTDGLLPI